MCLKGGLKPRSIIKALGGWLLLFSFLPLPAGAVHFSLQVEMTNRSADYLVSFKINGLPALKGDELAFVNPRGAVCGLYAVTSTTPQDYYPIHVYGDAQASSGETLTVKVWQASTGTEWTGSALALSSGRALTDYFQPSAVPPLWQDQTGAVLNVDTAAVGHFRQPAANPNVSNYIGNVTVKGQPAAAGSEVAAFDMGGVLRGVWRLTTPGQFGIMAIYGDDPLTIAGKPLNFRVWDASASKEYGGWDLKLSPGTASGSFVPSLIPPVWAAEPGYALAVDVNPVLTGDMNDNGRVELADAIIALQILARNAAPPGFRLGYVTDPQRLGLAEAIYILQRIAALR